MEMENEINNERERETEKKNVIASKKAYKTNENLFQQRKKNANAILYDPK